MYHQQTQVAHQMKAPSSCQSLWCFSCSLPHHSVQEFSDQLVNCLIISDPAFDICPLIMVLMSIIESQSV
uniref:Uncharacterized protein n=1 Tax=Rhizophora mucronata TaxID=61149 RepID=A0A2P2J9Q0_RHIMU